VRLGQRPGTELLDDQWGWSSGGAAQAA